MPLFLFHKKTEAEPGLPSEHTPVELFDARSAINKTLEINGGSIRSILQYSPNTGDGERFEPQTLHFEAKRVGNKIAVFVGDQAVFGDTKITCTEQVITMTTKVGKEKIEQRILLEFGHLEAETTTRTDGKPEEQLQTRQFYQTGKEIGVEGYLGVDTVGYIVFLGSQWQTGDKRVGAIEYLKSPPAQK